MERKLPVGSRTGFYSLNYAGVVRSDIDVVIFNDSTYIPLIETLSRLKIYYDYDFRNQVVSGFFIKNDRPYSINFKSNSARVDNRDIRLNTGDYLIDVLDIFILPSALEKIFPIQADVRFSSLVLRIKSDEDLPVLTQYKQKKLYSYLGSYQEKHEPQPLMFDRNRAWLNGSIIQYDLMVKQSYGDRNYNFNSTAGIELFGGDLQGNYFGYYNETTKQLFYDLAGRYRYYFGNNSYLTQAGIGKLRTGSYRLSDIPTYEYEGVQISNELTKQPSFFTEFLIQEQTEPGWQVELYRNGMLYDQMVADPQGYYEFNLPVFYGNSNIDLFYYGAKGEFIKKSSVLQIPTEFLSPGDIKYSLNAGRKLNDRRLFAEGRVSLGINEWLSNETSVEKNEIYKDIFIFNRSSIRLLNSLITDISYFHNILIKGGFRLWSVALGSHSVYFTKFLGNEYLNPSKKQWELQLNTGISRILGSPLNINFNLLSSGFENRILNYLNARAFINIYPFTLKSYYRLTLNDDKFDNQNDFTSHSISGEISLFWLRKPGFMSFLGGTRIGLSSEYDLTEKKVKYYTGYINQSISGYAGLNAIAYYNLTTKQLNYRAELMINFPSFRSNTKTDLAKNQLPEISQEIQGMLGFDSKRARFIFSNPLKQTSVGNGAASVRMFIDDNLNDEYDDGEAVIPDFRVDIPEGQIDWSSSSNSRDAYNLVSYSRYNCFILTESFDNPLVIPKYQKFSFIVDPNSYKPIDIPCYTSGVVKGFVMKYDGLRNAPQQGVKVHLMTVDSSYNETVPVFSDGSFYLLGAPPGDYIAWVDSLQMSILDVVQEESPVKFTVEKTAEGDFVEGIIFQLIDKNSLGKYLAFKVTGQTDNKEIIEKVPKKVPQNDTAKSVTPITKTDTLITKTKKPEVQKELPAVPDSLKIFTYPGSRSAELTTEMAEYLDVIANFLKDNPKAQVAVVGHSEDLGSLAKNMDISIQRAAEAVKYLQKRGILRDRIFDKGSGALFPIGSNYSAEGRAQNRRLEIRVLKKP